MANERITLSYRLGEKDYMALARSMERSAFERALTIGLFTATGLAGLAMGDLVERRLWFGVLGFSASYGVRYAAGIACAALLAGVAYLLWLRYWRGFLEGTARFDNVTVVAEPSGLRFQGGPLETLSPWRAFSRVVTTPDYVFLFLARRQGLIIPRAAFAKREDEEALLTWAKGASIPSHQAALTGHGPT